MARNICLNVSMEHIVIKPYDNKDKATISLVLSSVGWTTSQIEGQLILYETIIFDEG